MGQRFLYNGYNKSDNVPASKGVEHYLKFKRESAPLLNLQRCALFALIKAKL